jgi:hypothetical protein
MPAGYRTIICTIYCINDYSGRMFLDSTKFSNDKAANQSAFGHNTKRPGKKQDIELPLITEHEQPPW